MQRDMGKMQAENLELAAKVRSALSELEKLAVIDSGVLGKGDNLRL